MVPASCVLGDALLLGRDDVAREHRQHGAVHRHRHGHLVERDAVEEDLHVLDGVDRDARLADVADDARVVAVVAAVGGEVERDRQAHLPGGEVLRGRTRSTPRRSRSRRTGGSSTAGSRTSWPGRPARTGSKPGRRVDRLEALEVGGGVERLDVDALGRVPGQAVEIALELLLGEGAPLVERLLGEFRSLTRPGYRRRHGRSRCVSWRGGSPARARPGPGRRPRGRPGGPCRRGASRASARHGGRSGHGRIGVVPVVDRARRRRGVRSRLSTRRSCVPTSGVSPEGVTTTPLPSSAMP